MKQIINHFTDNDLYTFSCQYYIMQQYPRAEVEYTFIDRNNILKVSTNSFSSRSTICVMLSSPTRK